METFETGGGKTRTLPEGFETRGVVVTVDQRKTRYGDRAVIYIMPEFALEADGVTVKKDASGANFEPFDFWWPKTLAHPASGSKIRLLRSAARHYVLEVYGKDESFPPITPATKIYVGADA